MKQIRDTIPAVHLREMFKMGLVQNFENFFKAMKPALVDDKSAFVWVSNLNHPSYNLITHFSYPKEKVEESLDLLIKNFSPSIPHSCWVHSENRTEGLEDVLLERGYKLLAICPVMTWQIEAVPRPIFDIRKAVDMEAFYSILTITSKYEQALGKNVAHLLSNTDAEHFLGYIDNHPVGIVTLFRDGKTGVVSNLATLDKYQRKGCGRALMLTLMQRAHEMGLEKLVLGTSSVAEKLYESLGFEKQINIYMYARNSSIIGARHCNVDNIH